MKRLEGKVAVITGGGSGMGRSTVMRFLDEGASVVLGEFNETTAQETVELAKDAGHEKHVRFIRTDVASEADVEAMIALAVSEFGRLDVVFNNAGVGGAFGPITDITEQDWDYTFAVLLKGVFFGIKHGARVMKEQGEGGSIINTASIAGLSGGAGPQAYSAAKAGVVSLSQSTAVELGPHKIRVNAICPGGIATPLVSMGQDPSVMETHFEQLQPMPVAGKPEHIASAALFLASDDSVFVSGQALIVDGALEAKGPGLFGPNTIIGQITGVSRGSTGEEPTFRTP